MEFTNIYFPPLLFPFKRCAIFSQLTFVLFTCQMKRWKFLTTPSHCLHHGEPSQPLTYSAFKGLRREPVNLLVQEGRKVAGYSLSSPFLHGLVFKLTCVVKSSKYQYMCLVPHFLAIFSTSPDSSLKKERLIQACIGQSISICLLLQSSRFRAMDISAPSTQN